MTEYVVYGEKSGELKSFNTLREAEKFIKQLKNLDKKQEIEDIYFVDKIEWKII